MDSELENDYTRLIENEKIFKDKIKYWRFVANFVAILYIPILILFATYGTKISANFDVFTYTIIGLFILFTLLFMLAGTKQTQIQKKFSLSDNELLFLRTYETKHYLDLYQKESSTRREYYKELVMKSVQQVISYLNRWDYGNIPLTKTIIGDKVDLLKNNFSRLVYPNLAIDSDSELLIMPAILSDFSRFILKPTIEQLESINKLIEKLPYKEYREKGYKERIKSYLYSNPSLFRLGFSSLITIILATITYSMHFELAWIVTICVASFWGTMANFDKLFNIEKK